MKKMLVGKGEVNTLDSEVMIFVQEGEVTVTSSLTDEVQLGRGDIFNVENLISTMAVVEGDLKMHGQKQHTIIWTLSRLNYQRAMIKHAKETRYV